MNKNEAHVEMESVNFFLREDNGDVENTPNV